MPTIPWDVWGIIYQQCGSDKITQGKIIQLCKETKKKFQKDFIKKTAFSTFPNSFELTELFHQDVAFQIQLFVLHEPVGLFFPKYFKDHHPIRYSTVKHFRNEGSRITQCSDSYDMWVGWNFNEIYNEFNKKNTSLFFSRIFQKYNPSILDYSEKNLLFPCLQTSYFLCLHRAETGPETFFHSKNEYIVIFLKSIWMNFANFFISTYFKSPTHFTNILRRKDVEVVVEIVQLATWFFSLEQLNFQFAGETLKYYMRCIHELSISQSTKENAVLLQENIDLIKNHLKKEGDRFFELLDELFKPIYNIFT